MLNYKDLRNSFHLPHVSIMVCTIAMAFLLLSMESACNRLSKDTQEENREIDSQLLQEVPYLAFDEFRSNPQLDWISQIDNFPSLPDMVRCAVLAELWFQQYGDNDKAITNWYTSILGTKAHIGDIIVLVGVDNKLRNGESHNAYWPLLLYVDQSIADQLLKAMSYTELRFLNWEENKEDKELTLDWENSGEPFKSISEVYSFVEANSQQSGILTFMGSGTIGNDFVNSRAFHYYKLPSNLKGDGYIFQVYFADKEGTQLLNTSVNTLSFRISIYE